MAALAQAHAGHHVHVVDLPYRFSSWALDDADNVGLWVDGRGELAGWAVVQSPFWAIDCTCSPAAEPSLFPQMLAWADARARQVRGTIHDRPQWFVNVFATQAARRTALQAAGYADQSGAGEDAWSKVLMRRDGPPPSGGPPELPPGYVLRPLAGQAEVPVYVELQREVFGSKNMTVAWRTRTLAHPDYRPDLDLVVAAPDGRLAAFCICWLSGTAGVGQVEPLGVCDEARGLGLGRAILEEGLGRLHRLGAGTVLVETDNYRGPALSLYESAGFRAVHDVLVYRREVVEIV